MRLVCARLPNTQVFARTVELANYLIGYAVLPFWVRFVRAEENISNDDFSNDLFTDLAPLLNLFGEEVSKQFMSQSLGWADDIIFAMCPLGIITSIVSAVRAAGSPSLKAFIGRAREPRGSVEVEIFSSTSHDVCEIYGEEGIERVQSSSAVEQLLYFDPDPSDIQEESADTLPDIFDMDTAVQRRILKADPKSASPEVGIQPEVHKHPNILLNFNSSSSSTGRDTELWMVAVLSVVLQLAVLVFGALATYVWKWTKRGISVGSFAFPITAAGTLSVCVGLTLCSRIVEASTTETYWKINPEITKGRRLQIVWLQKARLIHGTNIQSLAIFASEDQQKNGLRCLRTSQRNLRLEESPHDDDKEPNKRYNNIYEPLVPIATFLTMAGYLLQLIGLREMHSSVALVQLAGTLLMAGMRVWVRRRLEERPITVPIFTGHEYDRLSLRIARCKEWVVRAGFEHKSMDIESPDQEKVAERVIKLRCDLASLSVSALPVWPQDISAVSAAVTKTITKTLQILDPLVDTSELSFDLAIDFILKRRQRTIPLLLSLID